MKQVNKALRLLLMLVSLGGIFAQPVGATPVYMAGVQTVNTGRAMIETGVCA